MPESESSDEFGSSSEEEVVPKKEELLHLP